MKVRLVICKAMPWAASSTVPIQPIISAEAWNSPLSDSPVRPMGQPRRNTSAKAARSGFHSRWNSRTRRDSARRAA